MHLPAMKDEMKATFRLSPQVCETARRWHEYAAKPEGKVAIVAR